jgi:hypothetical protein
LLRAWPTMQLAESGACCISVGSDCPGTDICYHWQVHTSFVKWGVTITLISELVLGLNWLIIGKNAWHSAWPCQVFMKSAVTVVAVALLL